MGKRLSFCCFHKQRLEFSTWLALYRLYDSYKVYFHFIVSFIPGLRIRNFIVSSALGALMMCITNA
jgi:hypothetical protein